MEKEVEESWREHSTLRDTRTDDPFGSRGIEIMARCCAAPDVACEPADYVGVQVAVREFVQEGRVVYGIKGF